MATSYGQREEIKRLLNEALARADEAGDSLLAALIAEAIDAIRPPVAEQ